MDMLDDFQKSISQPVLDFAQQNIVLLAILGILGVVWFLASGSNMTIVTALFDDREPADDGDSGSDGGD